ncbi:MAG: cytochrome c biogenesis protein CcdA [Helicobacter sp.]|nr:cytochrome c biogenesis protein CcdA [Helicobacter sp.]
MFASFANLILGGVSPSTIAISVFAGIATFLSPCILPLLPIYFSYLASVPISELQGTKKILFVRSLCFVLGFSLVFLLLGASMIGLIHFLFNQPLFTLFNTPIFFHHIAGIVVIVFGLQLLGVLHIGFLQREARIHTKSQANNVFGAFVLGIFFALGWSPCIGPLLSSIILLASSERESGVILLLCYTFGLALPFLLAALFVQSALQFLTKHKQNLMFAQKIAAALLLLMGILMLFGMTTELSALLVPLYSTN